MKGCMFRWRCNWE